MGLSSAVKADKGDKGWESETVIDTPTLSGTVIGTPYYPSCTSFSFCILLVSFCFCFFLILVFIFVLDRVSLCNHGLFADICLPLLPYAEINSYHHAGLPFLLLLFFTFQTNPHSLESLLLATHPIHSQCPFPASVLCSLTGQYEMIT